MRHVHVPLIAAMLLGVVPAPAGAAPANTIDLKMLRSYVEIEYPQFAPDGKTIAYVAVHQDFVADVYRDQVMLVDIASRRARPLGAPFTGLSALAWSPLGDRIAVSANAGKDASPQIVLLGVAGGENQQLTHAPRGVLAFAWRPDGGVIAYSTPDAPKQAPKNLDAFDVGDNHYLTREAPTPVHLWLAELRGGNARRLTSGSWSVATSEVIFPLPEVEAMPFISWSPDGRSILFSRIPNAYQSAAIGATTMLLDVASGRTRPLTSHTRLEMGAAFSRDGRHIAYAYARDDNPLAEVDIFVTPPGGGDGVDVTASLNRDALGAVWTPRGRLLIHAFEGARCRLWLVGTDGTTRRLNTGAIDAVAAMVDAGARDQVAFAGSTPRTPPELYYMESSTAPPVRLTHENATLAAARNGDVASITWSNDGFSESGALFYPPDFKRGKKYPLVLQIHGGPTEASVASWRDTDLPGLPELIAAHGYLVLSPNYRGSDGQGDAYQRAIFQDAGAGPGRDVMAGVEAVKQMGIVDSNRIAVSGWSYGGFMTQWLIGHDASWRAAVAGAGPADAFLDYATSDYNTIARYYFGGSPWDSPVLMDAYRTQSPIEFAANVKTPTLLLSDTGDFRVPIVHSYEFYHALKDRGVTVSFVAYPVDGHFPADPARAEDVYRRWVAWVDRYLK
jgi:dipeptidyl aminopeptidase/acylaminoacyl peptidase